MIIIGVAKALPRKHMHKLTAKTGYASTVAKKPFHFTQFHLTKLKT